MLEQLESENQRRAQYDKEFKQLQQQFNQTLQKEKQIQEQANKFQLENERLTKELRQINNEYQTIKTKATDYEEQIEGGKALHFLWGIFRDLIFSGEPIDETLSNTDQ